MRYLVRLVLVITAAAGCVSQAQTDSQSEMPKSEVVLINLFKPSYPPLARQARIAGDVEVSLKIRRDGSIVSATVVSGHPMLTEAALTSAQQSRFECRACVNEEETYSLVYSFHLDALTGPDFACSSGKGLQVTQSQNHITVAVEAPLVIPYFASTHVRSAKCLYLWRCGYNWGGRDYYDYRVRSAKCLGLWECGYRLREPFATRKRLQQAKSKLERR